MIFPKEFLWGAATASYQIEGASLEDGRGECIWHRYSHTPGNVLNEDNGDIACDHYHRYPEDVQLMQKLGLQGYRFSISWPRVLPHGTGAANAAGLSFYDKLVDALLEANIKPFATLYHWDLPQKLQDYGGWANPDVVKWFAEYADLMTTRLGDRVKFWATHNEPWVVAFVGNWIGRHAPGIQHLPTAFKVAHHLLLSHGAAAEVIRRNVQEAQVGIVLNTAWIEADTDKPEDIAAARLQDGFIMRWFADPLFKGEYPADVVEAFGGAEGENFKEINLADVKAAAAPLDFLGLNYYFRERVISDPAAKPLPIKQVTHDDVTHTKMGWEVYPKGLYNVLTKFNSEYTLPPVYITENGAAYDDPEPENDLVSDPARVSYLESHIKAVGEALQDGVPLKGYFVWSLLDNFEWGYGYDRRFGVIRVDFQTLKRTLKQSAVRYQQIIASNEVE